MMSREYKNLLLSFRKDELKKEKYITVIDEIVDSRDKNNHPTVSFILVAYNEGDFFVRCIQSIVEQKTDKNFEIIVVDNGLDDNTVNKVKKYNLLYIKTKENIGPSSGRNIAAIHARGPLLASIDSDGYIADGYVDAAVDVMRNEKIIAVRGKVLPIDDNPIIKAKPKHYDLGEKKCVSLIDTEGNLIIRKKDYLSVGGMEDGLYGHEGAVLSYRMIEFYGYDFKQFYYSPALILYHDYQNSFASVREKMMRYQLLHYKIQLQYPFFQKMINQYTALRGDIKERKSFFNIWRNIQGKIVNKKVRKMQTAEMQNRFVKRKAKKINNKDTHNFTVVITCYNLGQYIQKAVDSILAQTLENIEIIIVDDKSTDEMTIGILKQLEKNVKVKYLNKNCGVSCARNEGITSAKSEYILCLDADDTIETTYLEKAKNIFDADKNVGIVSCGLKTVGDEHWEWIPDDKLQVQNMLASSPLPTASCFRKKLSVQAGMYDTKLRGYEDWNHWISIAKQGCNVRVIPEVLFFYLTRSNSKVKTSNKNVRHLVGKIIKNHKELYSEYYEEIIIDKHEELIKLRSQMKLITGFWIVRVMKKVWKVLKRIKDKYIEK